MASIFRALHMVPKDIKGTPCGDLLHSINEQLSPYSSRKWDVVDTYPIEYTTRTAHSNEDGQKGESKNGKSVTYTAATAPIRRIKDDDGTEYTHMRSLITLKPTRAQLGLLEQATADDDEPERTAAWSALNPCSLNWIVPHSRHGESDASPDVRQEAKASAHFTNLHSGAFIRKADNEDFPWGAVLTSVLSQDRA